jgi:hypothetical protein
LGQQETRCKRQRHILDHPRTLNSGKIGVSLILAERVLSRMVLSDKQIEGFIDVWKADFKEVLTPERVRTSKGTLRPWDKPA